MFDGSAPLNQVVSIANTAAGVPLDVALRPFTQTVADHLCLPGKGRIERGGDADLLVLDDEAGITDVMAGGIWCVRNGAPVVRGPFEA